MLCSSLILKQYMRKVIAALIQSPTTTVTFLSDIVVALVFYCCRTVMMMMMMMIESHTCLSLGASVRFRSVSGKLSLVRLGMPIVTAVDLYTTYTGCRRPLRLCTRFTEHHIRRRSQS